MAYSGIRRQNLTTSVYQTLAAIDCSQHIEKKNGLTYLSWAWAWGILKEHYPTATYTVYENAQGCFYHTDGKTAWVKTGVTVEGIEHIEYLPVMDFKNKSIPVNNLTSFDVNKAIQRSLTKAVARHGLGLYIYAGEDLPEATKESINELNTVIQQYAVKKNLTVEEVRTQIMNTPAGQKHDWAAVVADMKADM